MVGIEFQDSACGWSIRTELNGFTYFEEADEFSAGASRVQNTEEISSDSEG